jgi:8-oxo-dGTP pyrophosphatase MutT (NUDIX family)
MLDLDPNREVTPPRDASTLVVVRSAPEQGVEVFCVERHKAGFMGGAVVFPGGKLDASDLDAAWVDVATPPRTSGTPLASDAATLRGLALAACREALEEAAILPMTGAQPTQSDLLAWRAGLAARPPQGPSLRERVASRGSKVDLGALVPFGRWVTPISEPRRFDTRFFLFVAGVAVEGRHDDHETTASFWATPARALDRFVAGELQLAPPTHRTLEILATARDATDAVAIAERACLDPICPELVTHRDSHGDTLALTLPGDPEHSIRVARVPGLTRFVLRGGRFLPEDARSE